MALTVQQKQEKLFKLIEHFLENELEDYIPKGMKPKNQVFNSKQELSDPRTDAKITHAHMTLKEFIEIATLKQNFYQRRLQNHLSDPIYKYLIKSMLSGHLIPELRVAALKDKSKLIDFDESLFRQGKLKLSIIDGLQRYCCFLIALYLAAKKDAVVVEGIITKKQYDDEFSKFINDESLKNVLQAPIRLEVYFNIEVKDLLKYMIIFNTAQKRMSLNHQLEIMEGAILQNLEENHKAKFERDTSANSKRNKFSGAELVLAIQAYLQIDHTISKNSTTKELFHKTDESTASEKIDKICQGIALLTNNLHPLVHEFYEDFDEEIKTKYQNILPNSSSQFVIPMMAALGRVIDDEGGDQSLISIYINRIIKLFKEGEDVFDLDSYYGITEEITSSRGATIRNLAERAFRNFWLDPKARTIDWPYALKQARP